MAWRAAYHSLARGNRRYGEAFLEGNFSPVSDELFERELPVDGGGALPRDLDGAFLRVGPNPALRPVGGYHW